MRRTYTLAALAIVWISGTAWAQRPAARPVRAFPGRAARPMAPSGYHHNVRALHTPTRGAKAPLDAAGKPKLVLNAVYLKETVALTAATDEGGFAAEELDQAAHVLRAPEGNEHPVEPRTLNVIYRIQRHFNAHEIRIISGYRTPKPDGTGQGNHGRGLAIDFVVPGATDQDVARFARETGFVGVGVYPISSFVHVDVRQRSYFWVDRSGPGRSSRERGVLLDVAQHADARARQRGDVPPSPFFIASDVDQALRPGGRIVPAGAEEEEED
ncbi:YcbK family protein [Pendulispora albinea]|uniref:DUF882 domain-containing protein n=1 Tax=Pendulispora albinea TaxID=2741071 RepID=A0ABZ2LNL0_9BACT